MFFKGPSETVNSCPGLPRIQQNSNGSLDESEKWLVAGCILKVEPTRFVDKYGTRL